MAALQEACSEIMGPNWEYGDYIEEGTSVSQRGEKNLIAVGFWGEPFGMWWDSQRNGETVLTLSLAFIYMVRVYRSRRNVGWRNFPNNVGRKGRNQKRNGVIFDDIKIKSHVQKSIPNTKTMNDPWKPDTKRQIVYDSILWGPWRSQTQREKVKWWVPAAGRTGGGACV